MTDRPPNERCSNCYFFQPLNPPTRIAGEDGKDGICRYPHKPKEHTLYTNSTTWCDKWREKKDD